MDPTGLGLLLLAGAAATTGLLPGRRQRLAASLVAAGTAWALVGRLGFAFLSEDWRYAYVVDNTRPGLAWPLRVAGLWAGPSGSLLVLTALIAVVLFALVLATDDRRSVGVVSALTGAYALILAAVADPFVRLAAPPAEGLGLQPVLEHEAMTWHPPALYAGLVAALGAGAFALTGGDTSRQRRAWLLALALLTIGLVTGSRWAHVELGWGGYWAWDPIENAGLVVWLTAAAAVHRPAARLLGSLTVIAAVWATTITRIGVIESVHAFADDAPLRLALVATACAITVGVGIVSVPIGASLAPRRHDHRSWAAAGLISAAVVVAIGTYEPAVERLIGGDAVAIAGRYYTRLGVPIALVGAGAALAADRRWVAGGVGGVVGAVAVGPAAGVFAMLLGAAGGATAASAVAIKARRGRLAHVGVGLLLIGLAGTAGTQRTTVALTTDDAVTLSDFAGGVTLTHRRIDLDEGPVTSRATATLDVGDVAVQPALVAFHHRSRTTSEMAEIHRLASFDGTLQVLLTDGDADRAVFQLYWQPRIGFVWLGALLVAVGSALALLPKQLLQRRATGRAAAPAGVGADPNV